MLEDSLKTREGALRRDLNEARGTVEKLQREVQRLRESRAETAQAQRCTAHAQPCIAALARAKKSPADAGNTGL